MHSIEYKDLFKCISKRANRHLKRVTYKNVKPKYHTKKIILVDSFVEQCPKCNEKLVSHINLIRIGINAYYSLIGGKCKRCQAFIVWDNIGVETAIQESRDKLKVDTTFLTNQEARQGFIKEAQLSVEEKISSIRKLDSLGNKNDQRVGASYPKSEGVAVIKDSPSKEVITDNYLIEDKSCSNCQRSANDQCAGVYNAKKCRRFIPKISMTHDPELYQKRRKTKFVHSEEQY